MTPPLLRICIATACALGLTAPSFGAAQQTDCPGADAPVAGPTVGARATLQCLVNATRTVHGRAGLKPSARLSLAAERHARSMVAQHFFEHVTPGGADVRARAGAAGYLRGARSWDLGEDVAWAQPTVTARGVVDAWMASPEHRAVILTAGFRDVGVGVAAGLPTSVGGAGSTLVLDLGVRHMAPGG